MERLLSAQAGRGARRYAVPRLSSPVQPGDIHPTFSPVSTSPIHIDVLDHLRGMADPDVWRGVLRHLPQAEVPS